MHSPQLEVTAVVDHSFDRHFQLPDCLEKEHAASPVLCIDSQNIPRSQNLVFLAWEMGTWTKLCSFETMQVILLQARNTNQPLADQVKASEKRD